MEAVRLIIKLSDGMHTVAQIKIFLLLAFLVPEAH